MPTGLLYSQCTFLSSQSEMLVTGVLILPLGEHQKILTISFTRVFSLALNTVQFTFEIRCRGEQNVTRHVAVVEFFLFFVFFVPMFFIYCHGVSEEKHLCQKGNISWFLFTLLLGDENAILFKYIKYTFKTALFHQEKGTLKKIITIMHLKWN